MSIYTRDVFTNMFTFSYNYTSFHTGVYLQLYEFFNF